MKKIRSKVTIILSVSISTLLMFYIYSINFNNENNATDPASPELKSVAPVGTTPEKTSSNVGLADDFSPNGIDSKESQRSVLITNDKGNLIDTEKTSYKLETPAESLASFNKHVLAEYCLNYFSTVSNFGSVEQAADSLSNETGHDYSELNQRFSNAPFECENYQNMSEADMLLALDNYLIESINLGNEVAQSKYASMLSQRSIFAQDIYERDVRLKFHQQAIEVLTKLSDKGHPESMLSLAMLLSEYVHFPETYDSDLALQYINRYEALTNRDMSKLKQTIAD
jgi:hypothetical protein